MRNCRVVLKICYELFWILMVLEKILEKENHEKQLPSAEKITKLQEIRLLVEVIIRELIMSFIGMY